jgi:nitrogenase molybdenum-iron protein NifN
MASVITNKDIKRKTYVSTRNACKLCAPLGACIVFKGIEGCVPMVHGSQGCATYIRRYVISHYREPMDIASSNFSEQTTVYGGSRNFITSINNVIEQYHPKVMGIASTCLAETIGEDIPSLIRAYQDDNKEKEDLPLFIHASTPSYSGSHIDGFHHTVCAAIATLSVEGTQCEQINILPGFVSPADLRYLREIVDDFTVDTVIFPDYSKSLDNVFTHEYQLIPSGGTPVKDICRTGSAKATIEFGVVFDKGTVRVRNTSHMLTAGEWLQKNRYVRNYQMPMPIGIEGSDQFMKLLSQLSGHPIPQKYEEERGRLVDAYVDAHKYVFGKRAMIFGEEDLVISLLHFCKEIGIEPILIGSGGASGSLRTEAFKIFPELEGTLKVLDNSDFETMREEAEIIHPDLLIGNSKGYYISRSLKIPLVRVGFPIHDRFGGTRLHHIGYRGTQELFDRIVNALIEYKQEDSPIGYKYI